MNTIGKIGVVAAIIFLINSWALGQPSCLIQVYVDGSVVKWVYAGGDEFNGPSIDTTKWFTCPGGWNREHGSEELQYYLDENISIENGILELTAKYEPGDYVVWRIDDSGNYYQTLKHFDYTSGWIQSKQKYKCGLFEMRFKLPEGNGLWPAFWLFGGLPNEEIDIFEYLGETPSVLYCTVHYPPHNQYHNSIQTTGNFSNGFNDIMGQWDDNWIFWDLNEYRISSWWGMLNFQESIRANLAVACEDCFGSVGPDSSTPFPSVFEIDFIRVWTRFLCEQDVIMENYHQTLTDPTVLTGNSICFNNNGCLQSEQYLTVIASEEILLQPGFSILEGSSFSAKIVECPIWGKDERGDGGNIQVINLDPGNSIGKTDTSDSLYPITDFYSLNEKNTTVELSISVFPNPSRDLVHVELNGLIRRHINISLYDYKGNQVFTNNCINNNTLDIDVSSLPKGIYALVCQIDKYLFAEKIILE